ncbi:MAG: adenylosuccinate synthetase, partial [SAR202 cluster bacterium]|nr:adenylosuccinate synthetase [SAR202 cluster bacterium]
HNSIIESVYHSQPLEFEDVFQKCKEWAVQLAPYIHPVERIINDAADASKTVIIEGAQGTMLDLDHGTYPFVTSSNPTIGGASTGLGLASNRIDVVLGVFKAYNTRVGNGNFLTELLDETGQSIRRIANEFGTTTGRPRRVGWFDSVVARHSARINGYTSLVLTRLDVLDGFESLKICTGYESQNGEKIRHFPGNPATLSQCKPVYDEFPGWDGVTAGVSNLSDLPDGARAYVDRIEELVGVPVDIISTGPHRDETIMIREVLKR